jgi:hypothetical protein
MICENTEREINGIDNSSARINKKGDKSDTARGSIGNPRD